MRLFNVLCVVQLYVLILTQCCGFIFTNLRSHPFAPQLACARRRALGVSTKCSCLPIMRSCCYWLTLNRPLRMRLFTVLFIAQLYVLILTQCCGLIFTNLRSHSLGQLACARRRVLWGFMKCSRLAINAFVLWLLLLYSHTTFSCLGLYSSTPCTYFVQCFGWFSTNAHFHPFGYFSVSLRATSHLMGLVDVRTSCD